jgi:adenylate cyclase
MDTTGRYRTVRRLAAILAADIAGYSRLIGADEEGVLNQIRSIRAEILDPAIAEHRGRLVKTTGDGLLVEFSSVIDAVRCAISIQHQMADRSAGIPQTERVEYRVGVHQGDVVVEDGDIFGDGVNVAARLEALADPGGICVSARVQEDSAGRLDLTFEDIGEQQLKNISRPIRVYRVSVGTGVSGRNAAVTVSLEATESALPLPDKPSVAVLPFANRSSDPEQEFLADGLAEDVITALSHYPSLFVIARNSSFTYKGRIIEVRQVGRELGVRYVLEGSLRQAGSRIRVTAQLIEAETGNHVWAERYDRDLADIFAIQDEISQAATMAIAPAIAGAERQRAMRKPPENLDAWAAYQQGLWHLSPSNAEEHAKAIECFQQAIDLDPQFVGGYCGLAAAQIRAAISFATHDLWEMLCSSEILVRRAVAINDADAEVRACLAHVLWIRGDYLGSQAEAEMALAISPNLAIAHREFGSALVLSGRRAEGTAALEKSFRLDPRDPRSANTLLLTAMSAYFSNDYGTATAIAQRIIRSFPDYPLSYRWLAAALGQLGRYEEAKWALDKTAAIRPASFDRFVRNRPPYIRPEDYAHMLEGLRKAGWEG